MLAQDLQRIGVAASCCGDGDAVLDVGIAACQRYMHAVGLAAQEGDGVVFVIQEGQDFIAKLKSDHAAVVTPAPGALVFQGSWSSVYNSVMSHLKSQP
jgi:hypothetical protein